MKPKSKWLTLFVEMGESLSHTFNDNWPSYTKRIIVSTVYGRLCWIMYLVCVSLICNQILLLLCF